MRGRRAVAPSARARQHGLLRSRNATVMPRMIPPGTSPCRAGILTVIDSPPRRPVRLVTPNRRGNLDHRERCPVARFTQWNDLVTGTPPNGGITVTFCALGA